MANGTKVSEALSGLSGLFDHYDSKKLAAVIKGVFAEFVILGLTALNVKFALGIPEASLQAAAGAVALICTSQILGQSYTDGKTGGATSGIAPEPVPVPAPPAAGFARLQLLLVVVVLATVAGACAAMKGDTVTASAGPHGGCVSSDKYVRLGNSQIECLSACISDQTGVQVTCRPISAPDAAQAMVIPTAKP